MKKRIYPPNYFKSDRVAGYDIAENMPPGKHSFCDCEYTVWSNQLGCFDKPYNSEEKSILLVGDSFTFGYVPFNYKYGTIIEKNLDYRVLKCGVSGYGTKQELFKIKKILEKIKNTPQLIIVGYLLTNDLHDDYLFPGVVVIGGRVIGNMEIPNYTTGQKELIAKEKLIEKINELENKQKIEVVQYNLKGIKKWLLKHSRVCQIIYDAKIKAQPKAELSRPESIKNKSVIRPPFIDVMPVEKYSWLNKAWEEHLDNLRKIRDLSEQYGAKLLVVLLPGSPQVYPMRPCEGYLWDWEQPGKILKSFLLDEKINYLDLTSLFVKYANKKNWENVNSKEDFYWKNDRHPSIKGNYLMGLLISRHIIENNLVEISDREQKKELIEKKLSGVKIK